MASSSSLLSLFFTFSLLIVFTSSLDIIHHHHHHNSTPVLTLLQGDATFFIRHLRDLYHAKIDVGTPSKQYVVALDTGSPLSWLPCQCTTHCSNNFTDNSGKVIQLAIYTPSLSSTSHNVSCGSHSNCPGVLVSDILYVSTYESHHKNIRAHIPFGCGDGHFLAGSITNGVLGIGWGGGSGSDVVSAITSNASLPNSFSICFPPSTAANGRLLFGDKGTPNQGQAPFDLSIKNGGYNLQVTEIAVEDHVLNVSPFTIKLDSTTPFTRLREPLYSSVANYFHSLVSQPRSRQLHSMFEYCYELSSGQPQIYSSPALTLTMEGGDKFEFLPTITLAKGNNSYFCLAITKTKADINILGHYPMRGYHMVFDRDRSILGWKLSNCNSNQFNITADKPRALEASITTSLLLVVFLVYILV